MPPKTPRRLTSKQQAFIDAFIAQGLRRPGDAYLKAYPTSSGWPATQRAREAYRLLKSPSIAPLISEAREKIAKVADVVLARAAMSKSEVLQKLSWLFDQATAEENFTGAVKVGELMAKLQGWITERRDVRVIRSIEDLTDEELEVLIEGRSSASMPVTAKGTRH